MREEEWSCFLYYHLVWFDYGLIVSSKGSCPQYGSVGGGGTFHK
jgi:hypothetical protein